jgi:hydroxylaminobenzene mutase
MLGLLTGWFVQAMANPRMGLSAHLEGLMNGMLLLGLAGCWRHVRLPASQEQWCWRLLVFGTLANWLAILLAAIWGAGAQSMPIAGAGYRAEPWQDQLVQALLVALSLAMVAAFALIIKGLLARRSEPV